MATKPTGKPTWCSSNPTDGVSGQSAISTPDPTKVASGFTRLERPPRQDFNYLFNLIGLWVAYLETLTDGHNNNLSQVNTTQKVSIGAGYETSTTLFQQALERGFGDADYLSGFRINTQLVSGGNIGVVVSRGSARLTTNQAQGVNPAADGVTQNWVKYIRFGGSNYPYAQGAAAIGFNEVTLSNNTWVHVFLIYKLADDTWDIGFDTNVNGTNLKASSDVDYVRRLGSLYYINSTEGFRQVRQYGDYFTYQEPVLKQFTFTSGTTTPTDLDVSELVPPNFATIMDARIRGVDNVSKMNGYVWLQSKVNQIDCADVALTALAVSIPDYFGKAYTAVSVDPQFRDKTLPIRAQNTPIINGQHALSGTGEVVMTVVAKGYWDLRGRDWGSNYPTNTQGRYFF